MSEINIGLSEIEKVGPREMLIKRLTDSIRNLQSRLERPQTKLIAGLMKSQDNFSNSLGEFQDKIWQRDLQKAKNSPRYKPGGFQSPESVAPYPNMCGYSATALTERIREVFGPKSARTVYGHFIDERGSQEHYWTEATVRGDKFAICATYVQFDSEFNGRMLIVSSDNLLERYKLKEYSGGGSEQDDVTLRVLKEHKGILPLERDMGADDKKEFEKLKSSLVF